MAKKRNLFEVAVKRYVDDFCEKYGLILDENSFNAGKFLTAVLACEVDFNAVLINNPTESAVFVSFRIEDFLIDVQVKASPETLDHMKTTKQKLRSEVISMAQEIRDNLMEEKPDFSDYEEFIL